MKIIRVSRQPKVKGPTQGMFEDILLDKHRASWGRYVVDQHLREMLAKFRRQHIAVWETIRYFDKKAAAEQKARRAALDVVRQVRAEEASDRALVGSSMHHGANTEVVVGVSSDALSVYSESKHPDGAEKGGSSKSGKTRPDNRYKDWAAKQARTGGFSQVA